MKNTALLIMAAGIGSRFGGGIKQLAPVDDFGHIIMDYSVHDAIEAGFNKIIFIIRRDIEKDFREVIGERIEEVCRAHGVEVGYAFQNPKAIPGEFPKGRTKPWGTGQAVLAAKDLVKEPFAVINADDYYGKHAYKAIHDWLIGDCCGSNNFCMAGFILKNTLSDNGGVTRGICEVDEENFLTSVVETPNIVRAGDGAEADGKAIDIAAYVSMNMWGLAPEFMGLLEEGFELFFKEDVPRNPLKAEYLLPVYIGELLRQKKVTVKLLPSNDNWFGVTYLEDKAAVTENFRDLLKKGVYKAKLFSDL